MFVIIVHSINLQPNIIHVSSNSSVFVCRVAGNYVLLPKTSIHMSIRVKHERADSSAGPKDLKVTTKFIYATPTDIYDVRRNGLRKRLTVACILWANSESPFILTCLWTEAGWPKETNLVQQGNSAKPLHHRS